MKKAIVIVATLGIVLLLGGAVLAKGAASGYSVPWHAFTSGGEHDMSSDNYTMFSTAGQELVGGTSSDAYQLAACRRELILPKNAPLKCSFWPEFGFRAPLLPRKRIGLGTALFTPTAC
jgi:hypothetical protein